MSKTKFTPGPWEAGRADVASIVDGVDSKWIYGGGEYCAIASGRVTGSWETVMANAHLIAAAPELYEALEASNEKIRTLLFDGDDHPLVSANKAALAKARGETHPSGGDRHGE
ncbi:hypothetical protein FHV99_001670 [Ochrobactrum sp. P20RRXII]|nr:hypothetical protein [Ochrobactrum sp. P20RRXII]NIH74463.1 hypothetical protein [Ochrobactrum sp. P20RRXII]